MTGGSLPAGYQRLGDANAVIVARDDVAAAVRDAYEQAPADNRTLHGFAAKAPGVRTMQGRSVAYAITLPGTSLSTVVRHNAHGGLFRALTGDLFAGRPRAAVELRIALALPQLGIPTPAVVAYAIYPVCLGLSRSDVLTEEIRGSTDLGETLLRSSTGSADRVRAWKCTTTLLATLANAGVRHHDLNVKNILIGRDDRAYLLDVDRVKLSCHPVHAAAKNRQRLLRSMEKWKRTRGAKIEDGELEFLQERPANADATTTSS